MRVDILSSASAAVPHFSSKYLALLIPALLTTQSSPVRAFSTTTSAHRPAAFPTGAARRAISMSGGPPPSPVTAKKPVRVLALHGYGQTGETFSQKMVSEEHFPTAGWRAKHSAHSAPCPLCRGLSPLQVNFRHILLVRVLFLLHAPVAAVLLLSSSLPSSAQPSPPPSQLRGR